MSISFNAVPSATLAPFTYVEFDASRAQQGAGVQPFEALILGQKLAGGLNELEPTTFTNAADVGAAYGLGSHLHVMARAWFANNARTKATFVAIDDAAGSAAAAGSITFTGAPTAAGTVALLVHGERVSLGVSAADTAATIATRMIAAIEGTSGLMVSATAGASGVVTLTAKNKGTLGNGIDVRVNYYEGDATPAGLTVVIAPLSGGATDPDVAEVWPVLGDTHYNVVACPFIDPANLASIETEFEGRFGPSQKRGAVLLLAGKGTHGALTTLGDGRNSKHTSIMGFADSPSAPWAWSAAIAGQVAASGSIDPARPFTGLPLLGILAPALTQRFTLAERDLLLQDGISTHTVDANGTVSIDLLVTNYQTGPGGAPDTAYQLVRTRLTLEFLRWSLGVRFARYARHKLASDGTRFGAGQKIMTPRLAKAEALALFRDWEELGLVEGFAAFKASVVAEINAQNANRLDLLIAPNLVNGFTVAGVQIQFIL